jgi:phosphopantothenoylcysteine decarboxylase/phosphopantothenate--cysteine ligase
MNVLITCGATRNPVDAMRFVSSRSSGTTGITLARALVAHGHRVHVLGSPEAALRAPELDVEIYDSTRDLFARMERYVRGSPTATVVHAAAVGDYEVAHPSASKTASGSPEWTLTLTPTPKIADHLRGWGLTGPYVTFKAAAPETTDDALVEIASKQRARTGSDLVFANVLGRIGERVCLVSASGPTWFAHRDDAVAALIAALLSPAAE